MISPPKLKMDEKKSLKFHVVQFAKPPQKVDTYVCVPDSWFKLRQIKGRKVLVHYPIENHRVTKKRVKTEELPSDTWLGYEANVKFSTNNYKEAKKHIAELNKKIPHKPIRIKIVDKGHRKKLQLKRSSSVKSKVEIEAPKMSQNPSNYGADPTLNNLNSEKSGTTESESSEKKRYFTRQTRKQDENDSHSNKNIEETLDRLLSDCSVAPSGAELMNLLNKICGHLETERVHHERMQIEFATKLTMVRQVLKLVEAYNTHYGDICAPTQEEETILDREVFEGNLSEEKVNRKRLSTETNTSGDENEDIEDETVNKLPKLRGKRIKLVLPQEFDENDSRWTLKHRFPKKGLEELIPGSNIYIDSIGLKRCQLAARDGKTFARMLLLEVFTQNALKTCSLTGKRANIYCNDEPPRPGLDRHALNILLDYVQEYAANQRWGDLDRETIITTIRNKVQDMRRKYYHNNLLVRKL